MNAPMADPPYSDGPSRPIAPPIPSVAIAAMMRPIKARGRSGYSESWNARRYSSEVAGDAPLPTIRRMSAAATSPRPGAMAANQSGPCRSLSKATSATTYSKKRTPSPVIAPVTAASNTTSRDRRTRLRSSPVRISKEAGIITVIALGRRTDPHSRPSTRHVSKTALASSQSVRVCRSTSNF